MKIFRDKKAQGNVISWFIGAAIAVIIALQVAWPVIDGAANGGNGAYSTLTLSGNTSCGQLINVTNPSGYKVTFQLNITGTTQGYCTAPVGVYHTVQIPQYMNTSTTSATNITSAMNANASITGTMTATNPSAGVVTLTYNTKGQAGNNAGVVLSETLSSGTWSYNTLTNGVSDAGSMPASAQALIALIGLFLALSVIMIFIRPLL